MRHAKIAIPPRPPGMVTRAQIRDALETRAAPVEQGRVLLVSAPTGHGKTVALADWVRATGHQRVAWVSLDVADRDEARWWESILGAIRPGLPADSPLHGVHLGADGLDGAGRREFLATVLDALDELEGPRGPVQLVLDDVHEIVGHPAERGLRDLVRYPLRGVTVVLSGRFDPPIGLERLRLQGRLAELRVDELVFTAQDATSLFTREGLSLAEHEVATLVERTQGWAAALRLAAMSLRGASDPSAVVAEFAGDDLSVADYLVNEVLAVLDDRERRVLEVAGVCSPAAVELVGALTGDPGAAEVLEHLETTTAMIMATDRRREHFTTHELLRTYLLARLRRARPDRLRDMYLDAAHWHDDRNDPASAVHWAALAGDLAETGSLLRARAVELIAGGAFASLEGAQRLLESHEVAAPLRPVLALLALERGEVDHGAALLIGARGDGDLEAVVRTRLALARGDADRAHLLARDIHPETMAGAPRQSLALATRGYALATVDPERARVDAEKALTLAEEHRWTFAAVQARAVLSLALVHGDRVPAAAHHARTSLELAARHGWSDRPWSTVALVALGAADVLAGRHEEALGELSRAEGSGSPHPPTLRRLSAVLLGAAEYDAGRTLEGWRRMRSARMRAGASPLEPRHVAFAAVLEQEAALGLGRGPEAAEVTAAVGAQLDGAGDGLLLRARENWARTRDIGARHVLAPALAGTCPFLTALAAIEAGLLDAEIALTLEQHAVARQRIHQVLRRAADVQIVRPLLHAPIVVRRYFEQRRGSFGELDALVDRVLTAPEPPDTHHHAIPLTEREREVLRFLPTLESAMEIAEDLAVSTNTVKTHQRSIYQKLGAANRRDAVARARRIGLLEPAHH